MYVFKKDLFSMKRWVWREFSFNEQYFLFEISFSCFTLMYRSLLTASDEVRNYLLQNLRSISCKLLEQKQIYCDEIWTHNSSSEDGYFHLAICMLCSLTLHTLYLCALAALWSKVCEWTVKCVLCLVCVRYLALHFHACSCLSVTIHSCTTSDHVR